MNLDVPIEQAPLAFMDVETTGLDPLFGHRVCEIAVVRCTGHAIEETMDRLVNPQRPMGEGALRVHGISDAMLQDAPLFEHIADELLALLEGAVFVAHNAPFDLGFLASELVHARRPLPMLVALDTLRLARNNMQANSYSLGNLCLQLGIELDDAHRAMNDVLATRELFLRLVARLKRRGAVTVADYIRAQGGPLRRAKVPAADVPPAIRDAMQTGRLLHMRYSDARGAMSERLVRPIQVESRGGRLYLVAHCLLRNDSRTFAVERIQAMAAVDDTAEG